MAQPSPNTVSSALTDQIEQQFHAISNQQFQAISKQLRAIRRQNKRTHRQLRTAVTRVETAAAGIERVATGFETIATQTEEILQQVSTLEFGARNLEIRARNERTLIQPLVDVRTGAIIPDCPTTTEEILDLPTERTELILQALQISVDQGAPLAEKQEAVRLALLA